VAGREARHATYGLEVSGLVSGNYFGYHWQHGKHRAMQNPQQQRDVAPAAVTPATGPVSWGNCLPPALSVGATSALEHFRFTWTYPHQKGSLSIYSADSYQGVMIPKHSRASFAPTHRAGGAHPVPLPYRSSLVHRWSASRTWLPADVNSSRQPNSNK